MGVWLIFFLITSYLGCLSLAMQAFRAQSAGRALLLILNLVATFLPAFLVGLRSRLVFPALWVHAAIRLAVTGTNLSILWNIRNEPGPDYFHDIFNQVSAVAITVIWLLYFHRSRRVRETFGENL